MKESTSFNTRRRHERGSGLIVVILVSAFMLAIGMVLLTVTRTNTKVSDNVRLQSIAFDAAEGGFNAAWKSLNAQAANSFAGLYRTQYKGATGLDDPADVHYFRKLTDEEILADLQSDPSDTLYVNEPLPSDSRCTFSVFLISDEAPGTIAQDDADCLMICIGRGPRNTTKRLEILIEIGS